jgi:flagellar basal-body rod protein FlgC
MIENAITTAFSGLRAATQRISGVASNVANAGNTSPLKPDPAKPAYQPVQTVQTAVPGGGVLAAFQPLSTPTVPAFQPDSPDANSDGLVGVPNVDMVDQSVDMIMAQLAFSANLKTIEAAQQMQDETLKLKV